MMRSEKTAISGSIAIYNGNTDRFRTFCSNSKWFDGSDYFSIKQEYGCLRIIKHYLEIPYKARKVKKGQFQYLSEIPIGRFEFDEEESTEDELVIYYQEQLK
jgi:hypothetical protein